MTKQSISGVEIIAEAEINHDGKVEKAKMMVDAAKACGADSVKFQCFVPEAFIAPGSSFMPIFKSRALGVEDFREIKKHADSINMRMFSTASDLDGLAMITDIGLDTVKLGSTNINNIPLLKGVASTGMRAYLSTGAATLGEIETALDIISQGTDDITLFHCTVQYPTADEFVNVRALTTMKAAFPHVRIGFSDHTQSPTAAIAAVALGAEVLEKHFTLDNAAEGPDHAFSTNPEDMRAYVDAIRQVEVQLGSAVKQPVGPEHQARLGGRRYVTAYRDIDQGTVLTADMVRSRRVDVSAVDPETLLTPDFENRIVGRRVGKALKDGDPITLDVLQSVDG